MTPRIKQNLGITLHKDGSVSFWDVYRQQWQRTWISEMDHKIVASFSAEERSKIERRKNHKKRAKTIMQEADDLAVADEYDFYADAEREREISRATYYRVCAMTGLARQEAEECLLANYRRAGMEHMF